MAFAPTLRPIVAKGASRDLKYVLLVTLVMFVPAIATVVAVVVAYQESVHRGTDQRRMRAAADSRDAQHRIRFCNQHDQAKYTNQFNRDRAVRTGVAAFTLKEMKSHRSRLIVLNAISAKSLRLRCAQYVEKKLLMLACLRYAPICLDRLVRVVTTKRVLGESPTIWW